MITVRFDYADTEQRGEDHLILRVSLPTVPEVGESINLRGQPYRVIERGWALDEPENGPAVLYAYVRVR